MTKDGYYERIKVELETRQREIILEGLKLREEKLSRKLARINQNKRGRDYGIVEDAREEGYEIENTLNEAEVYEVKA